MRKVRNGILERMLYYLFLKGKEAISLIQSENKYLIGRLRGKLKNMLYNILYFGVEDIKPIQTKNSIIYVADYLDIFTKNIFQCILSLYEPMKNGKILIADIPNILYHGTTTKFLPEIIREGLLPTKAGQCWEGIKEQKIFLTDSLYIAEANALYASHKFGGEPIILLIDVKELKRKLEFDIITYRKENPSAFDISKEFTLEELIPPEKIKDWYIIPKQQSLYLFMEAMRNYYLGLLGLRTDNK